MPRITRRVYSSMPRTESVFDIPRVNVMVDQLRTYYGLPIGTMASMKDFVITRLRDMKSELEYYEDEDEDFVELAIVLFHQALCENGKDMMLEMIDDVESLQQYRALIEQRE